MGRSIPVAIINPVSAKAFGKRRLQRIKSDPADAYPRCPGMADQPWTREPLAGAELREAARFRMCVVGLQHKPTIAAHYARKRAQGKSKMHASLDNAIWD